MEETQGLYIKFLVIKALSTGSLRYLSNNEPITLKGLLSSRY